MWLLNTETLRLELFYSDIPSYAILSHRWVANEELTFEEINCGSINPYQWKSGYIKVERFCKVSRENGFSYAWADTCCIDKKSSAELSDNINSMYRYYERAGICYAYLNDVTSSKDLASSAWFTRGWTLQELLAPSKLQFFNYKWLPIGSKRSLASKISSITRISPKALYKFEPDNYCIAERFSWSGNRQTTREEDSAYCLLGIFRINMPLLYGEGTRAFQRLQEEIMKISTDLSIFLWQGPAMDTFGMLASHPSCFLDVPEYVQMWAARDQNIICMSEGWNLNNAGISMYASIYPYLLTHDQSIFALQLQDASEHIKSPGFALFIRRHGNQRGINSYSRVTIDGQAWTSSMHEYELLLQFRCRVQSLRLLRQPLQDFRTQNGIRGLVGTCTSTMAVMYATQKRYEERNTTFAGIYPLKDKEGGTMLSFRFSVNPRLASGIRGHLRLGLSTDIHVSIFLGWSGDLEPLCIILPFSKPMIEGKLDYLGLQQEYERDPKSQGDFVEVFETPNSMICLCANETNFTSHTMIGVSVAISAQTDEDDTLSVAIDFDVRRFVRFFVAGADLSSLSWADKIPDSVLQSLQKVDTNINSARLANKFGVVF